MMQPHRIRYRLNEADVVAAARHVAIKRLKGRVFLVLIGAFILLALFLAYLQGLSGDGSALVVALIVALPLALVIVIGLLVPWQARRHFRQSRALRDEVQAELTAEGIAFDSDHGSARFDWGDFHSASETGRLLLLFQSEMLYNAVPKAALGEEGLAIARAGLKAAQTRSET